MSNITKAAKGEECDARIPDVCKFNTETTVFAHLNGAGMGRKHNDLHGCNACFECHFWLDGGYVQCGATREQRDLAHLQAMVRTQQKNLDKGLIKI